MKLRPWSGYRSEGGVMPTAAQSVETLLKTGVRAVLLATADGFVIEAATHTPGAIDFDSLAAEVAGMFRAANLMGRGLATSSVRSVVITLDNDQIVIAVPIAGEAIAAILPQPGTVGLAPKTLDHIREAMHHFLELHTGKQLLDAVSRVVESLPGDEREAAARSSDQGEGFRPGRIALTGVETNVVGNVATVRVTLGLERREAKAKAVGRDLSGQRATLAGDATIRAMLELLPAGHAVELTHLQATTPSREALWVLTRFLSPDGEQSLFGIAPVQSNDEATSAAKAILNAVNRRVEMLLTRPTV